MHTVSVADAKAHLSEILNEVIAGEEVIITRRGQAIARLEGIKKPLKPIPNLQKFRSKFSRMKVSSREILKELKNEGY